MFRMVAKLNPYASIVPASVYTSVGRDGSKPAFAKRGPNHQGITNRERTVVIAAVTRTDGMGGTFSSLGYYSTACDIDGASVAAFASADAGCIITAVSFYMAAGDGNVLSSDTVSATDAGTAGFAPGNHLTSVDVNVRLSITAVFLLLTAANACALASAYSLYFSSKNGNNA